jgi:hypothetical protein
LRVVSFFSDGEDEFAFGEDFGVDVVIPGVLGLMYKYHHEFQYLTTILFCLRYVVFDRVQGEFTHANFQLLLGP